VLGGFEGNPEYVMTMQNKRGEDRNEIEETRRKRDFPQ